jgi:hypothetical protein
MTADARKTMWVPDVAKAAGLSDVTISRYHSLAEVSRRNKEHGMSDRRQPADTDLPVPDGYGYPPGRVSGSLSPWWWPETITPWLAVRAAVSPGRPRGDGTPATRRKKAHARPGPRPKQRTRRKAA